MGWSPRLAAAVGDEMIPYAMYLSMALSTNATPAIFGSTTVPFYLFHQSLHRFSIDALSIRIKYASGLYYGSEN
jgi:hypothetical protein